MYCFDINVDKLSIALISLPLCVSIPANEQQIKDVIVP